MFNSGSDPFINALKSFGYNVVRLPKADIQPLQILSKNGNNLERLGAMTKLLTAGDNIPVPAITSGNPVAPISGSRTSELKLGLGLSILGNIIGALGGTTLGLEAQYARAKSAVFEFQDVTEDKVDIVDIDQYLGDADIQPASVFVSKLLEADQIYVLTSVIKSTKFTFEAKIDKDTSLKVNIPVIQQIVGGNVNISAKNSDDSKITYEGKIPMVFGFQAIQLFYDKGRYTSFKPAENIAMRSLKSIADAGIDTENIDVLVTNSAFTNLIDR